MPSTYSKQDLINLATDYAYGYGINPNLAVAQINRESGFNPNAVGTSNEHGLAQIMPGTWQRFSGGIPWEQSFDPDYNLTTWGNYMSYLSGLFGGDEYKILVSYNGGEGHVLDPGRYGAPSAAAKRYASELLAQAGGWPTDIPVVQAGDQPQPESSPNWLLIGGIGVAVLILLFAFSDN